ncbi:protein NEN1-like [Actinidia eriantha]|uniref:protein NEN1-like n=1 Tax=Actinidia eriantha TaxID=165200 RepID=UPI00258FEB06|nr:protein NEN1-like [Actinidia eriantha]
MVSGGDRSEIAFFDVETTVPTRSGQGYAILEFGAILVCPRKLVETQSYSTLVRPADLSLISSLSVRCNGITQNAVVSAPNFAQIADQVYEILHGRIWAGHNILKFDCPRIREAFAEINRPPPEPKDTIDSLAVLTQRFGRRAGDMKMATLAAYFGLGQQTHRSLDDVRMNLEVLKYCATVLFLESCLPDIFTEKRFVSPPTMTRSHSNGKLSRDAMVVNTDASSSSVKIEINQISSVTSQRIEVNHPMPSIMTPNKWEDASDRAKSNTGHSDPFDLGLLSDEVMRESIQSNETVEEESGSGSPQISIAVASEGSSDNANFIEADEVSITSISVLLAPFYRGTQRIQIMHKDIGLQLCCNHLKVRFGISTKFIDHAGRPRLSFVVDGTPNLCWVLDACDSLAQKLSIDSGSSSEWWPIVTRKSGFLNSPTIRLHIPTVADGSVSRWLTDIYQKDTSTTTLHRLVFSRFDVAELDALFTPGIFVDAFFSLDPYDYQQNAGIRLVAKKLIIHS